MKGRIDVNGFLWILRGNIFKVMRCPGPCHSECCDDCPHFSEPNFHGSQVLKICQGKVLEFTEGLEDERPKV